MKLSITSLGHQGDGVQHVLVVGANGRSVRLVESIVGKGSSGCHIEGFVDDDADRHEILEGLGVHYLGQIAALDQLMIDRVIDCVYVCLPLRSAYDKAQRVVDLCGTAGVPVLMVADVLPLRSESDALWSVESQYPADQAQGSRASLSFALKSPLSLLFAALSAAVSAGLSASLFGLV